MGEILVGFPVYSCVFPFWRPLLSLQPGVLPNVPLGHLQWLIMRSRRAEAASCNALGRDRVGRQTQLPWHTQMLPFLTLCSFKKGFGSTHGIPAALSSAQGRPKRCCTGHCPGLIRWSGPSPLCPWRPRYRPGFVEPFLRQRGAWAGCRLRDLHVLLRPCFHGIHLELLCRLHAHIHGHAGALLCRRAHVLGATAETKFYILAQQLPREPRAKEIKGTS